MKNKWIVGLWVLFSLILFSCSSLPSSQSTRSLTGTKWVYIDEDWTYDVEFINDGILETTHPNDRTPDNDFWEQEGDIVFLFFNNKFSIYEGQFITDDLIKGTGKNLSDSWDFELYRIK